MKPVLMFIMESCPYCMQALKWMKELRDENSKYSGIEVTSIDETLKPDLADQYDYYYVPAYYIDGIKIHEGAASKDVVRGIFEEAIK